MKNRVVRFSLLSSIMALFVAFASPNAAWAMSCWQLTGAGWAPTASSAEQAILAPANCTTIPSTVGWVQIVYGLDTTVDAPMWLQLPVNDPHLTVHGPNTILYLQGYDTYGTPVIVTSVGVSNGASANLTSLLPYPPQQGLLMAGARVRLRHNNGGQCIYSLNQNGASAKNGDCWNGAAMVYVLDAAGSGNYRLRHEQSGQCIYTSSFNGQPVSNSSCSTSPAMSFKLESTGNAGSIRLRNVSTNQCVYGNPTTGGNIHSWVCWDDREMDYYADVINYPVYPIKYVATPK